MYRLAQRLVSQLNLHRNKLCQRRDQAILVFRAPLLAARQTASETCTKATPDGRSRCMLRIVSPQTPPSISTKCRRHEAGSLVSPERPGKSRVCRNAPVGEAFYWDMHRAIINLSEVRPAIKNRCKGQTQRYTVLHRITKNLIGLHLSQVSPDGALGNGKTAWLGLFAAKHAVLSRRCPPSCLRCRGCEVW